MQRTDIAAGGLTLSVVASIVTAAAALAAVPPATPASSPPCVNLPAGAFVQQSPWWPTGEALRYIPASAGRTFAKLLVPAGDADGTWLYLARDGKLADQRYLRFPPELAPHDVLGLALDRDGDVVVIRTLRALFVYQGASFVRRIDAAFGEVAIDGNDLYWCPEPIPEPGSDQPPPLLVHARLDDPKPEVLLRADPERTAKDGDPIYQKLAVAVRDDGKLWLVGHYDGRILLTSKGGRVLGEWPCPVPEAAIDVEAANRKELDAAMVDRTSDATRRQGKVEVSPATRAPILLWAQAHGRDLVVQLLDGEATGALVVFVDGEPAPCCVRVPETLAGSPALTTRDGLIFLHPYGTLPWEAVQTAVIPPETRDTK